jgi:prolyl-tRNA synthetase
VHIVATGKDDAVFAAAESLAVDLDAAGVRVMYDDRWSVSPGVKFKDAELIGVPWTVIVGKNLAEGVLEVRNRRTDERRNVAIAEVGAAVIEAVRG